MARRASLSANACIAENSGGNAAGETICVDNFQVTPVPEPGTTAVLALGGVALLFFRRRSGR
jgi:lysozyme family protein